MASERASQRGLIVLGNIEAWRRRLRVCSDRGLRTVLGSGCRKHDDSSRRVTVEHEITPQPVHVGNAEISLRLMDSSGRPIVGAHMTVEADMSHAGMSPVFAEAKESEAGRYHSQLSFGMAGDWVILLHGTLPNGEKLERQFDVPGVRSN